MGCDDLLGRAILGVGGHAWPPEAAAGIRIDGHRKKGEAGTVRGRRGRGGCLGGRYGVPLGALGDLRQAAARGMHVGHGAPDGRLHAFDGLDGHELGDEVALGLVDERAAERRSAHAGERRAHDAPAHGVAQRLEGLADPGRGELRQLERAHLLGLQAEQTRAETNHLVGQVGDEDRGRQIAEVEHRRFPVGGVGSMGGAVVTIYGLPRIVRPPSDWDRFSGLREY